MDWVNFNYKLTHINNILESTTNAAESKLNGKKTADVLIDFGNALTGGALRNEIAYDMKRTTGSDLGIAINNAAGFGTQESNNVGMKGLMQASIFNGMFGGGCCGGGFYGGMPMMGMGGYPMMGGGMPMMGPTYASPGVLGGMINGMQLPSMAVHPNWGTSAFNYNGFFA